MNLKVIFEPNEDGDYTAYVPSLPGCPNEGDTNTKALFTTYYPPVAYFMLGHKQSLITI